MRGPLQELCDELNETGEFGKFWLSGMSDRPAAWQSQHATSWIARRIRISFTFDLDGFALGGGSAIRRAIRSERFRAMVDAEDKRRRAGRDRRDARPHRFRAHRADRGADAARVLADHPRADLLRRRSVYAEKPIDTHDVGLIGKALRPLIELTTWYTDYVVTTGWEKP